MTEQLTDGVGGSGHSRCTLVAGKWVVFPCVCHWQIYLFAQYESQQNAGVAARTENAGRRRRRECARDHARGYTCQMRMRLRHEVTKHAKSYSTARVDQWRLSLSFLLHAARRVAGYCPVHAPFSWLTRAGVRPGLCCRRNHGLDVVVQHVVHHGC